MLARVPPRLHRPGHGLSALTARTRSKLRSELTLGRVLAAAGITLLAVAGYFLLYQAFLHQASLADLTRAPEDAGTEPLRYDGVADFQGHTLEHMEGIEHEYAVPNVVGAGIGRSLQVLVRTDPATAAGRPPGRLVIVQEDSARPVVVELQPQHLQRLSIPWDPVLSGENRIAIRYESAVAGGRDDATAAGIQLAVEVADVGLWPYALILGLGGLALLAAAVRSPTGPSFGVVAIVGVSILVMAYLHSGAMASNVLFEGNHGKIAGQAKQLSAVWETGSFQSNIYRGAGFSLVPLVTAALEGRDYFDYAISQVYPSSRYVFFLWVAASLAFLLVSLHRHVGATTALAVGLLYASFFPFVVDIYSPDADAYFIPLMTVLLGAYLYYRRSPRLLPLSGVMIALTVMIMLSVKTTPAFLILLLPLAGFARTVARRRTWRDPRAAVLLMTLLVAGFIGASLSTAFYPEDRNVGVPGVEFQDHVGWHILWAATGRFEPDNPHGFVKSNRLRREAVARVTGLPEDVSYIHQSQLATDLLYRPGFINMLQERPGFYYGTSMLRGYERAAYVYRYEEIPLIDRLINEDDATQLVNRDEMWKIAPTYFLGKLVTDSFTPGVEILLLLAGCFGILALRRLDLAVLLLGCVLADVLFTTFVHVPVRYMNFTNVALLIGLGVFLVAVLRTLWANGAVMGQRPRSPAPTP